MTKLINHYYKSTSEVQKYIDKLYTEWVTEQPCCISGSVQVAIPHHVRLAGYCGMGQKPDDIFKIPITYLLHTEIHTKGVKTFANKHKINFIDILGMLHTQFCEEMEIVI